MIFFILLNSLLTNCSIFLPFFSWCLPRCLHSIQPPSPRRLQMFLQFLQLLRHVFLSEDIKEFGPPFDERRETILALLIGSLHIQKIIKKLFPLHLPPAFVSCSLDSPLSSNFDYVIVDVPSEE